MIRVTVFIVKEKVLIVFLYLDNKKKTLLGNNYKVLMQVLIICSPIKYCSKQVLIPIIPRSVWVVMKIFQKMFPSRSFSRVFKK